jgi:ABC-type protease/lipase transport system fused ATPase/permease subunit
VAKRRKITIGFGLAWLVVAVVLYLIRGWDIALVILGTGVLLTVLVYLQQWRTAHDIRVAGQARALELHEQELRSQGYDQFWSDPQEVQDSVLGVPSTQ